MRAESNWKPERLDIDAFAREAGELRGQWSAELLPRWLESQWLDGAVAAELPPVLWAMRGSCRERVGASPETWLEIEASTGFRLECQRCLHAVAQPLALTRRFRFVRDEAQAEAEDPDCEEDLLVLSRAFDARELVEDELLLALPLVPMHEDCEPPPVGVDEFDGAAAEETPPHPFAALAVLKKKG